MDILEKIQDATSLDELDQLRDEIHIAASYGEIDFKYVKRAFLAKQKELETGNAPVSRLNWLEGK